MEMAMIREYNNPSVTQALRGLLLGNCGQGKVRVHNL